MNAKMEQLRKLRKDFEAWMLEQYPKNPNVCSKNGREYFYYETEDQWKAWKAAALKYTSIV